MIKEYLYQNPGAMLSEVSVELNISLDKIERFLKEGRLELTSEEGSFHLECEMCGKSIRSGRLCDECEQSRFKKMRSVSAELSSKMYGSNKNSSNFSGSSSKEKMFGLRHLNKKYDNKKYDNDY